MFEETSQRRIIGALILLLGFSFFAIGLQTKQVQAILDVLKGTFAGILIPL